MLTSEVSRDVIESISQEKRNQLFAWNPVQEGLSSHSGVITELMHPAVGSFRFMEMYPVDKSSES